jgi:HEAT repeat protein
MKFPQTAGFLRDLADRLCNELAAEQATPGAAHMEKAAALATVTQSLGEIGELEHVLAIGQQLERSLAGGRNRDQHADCCRKALETLLAPSAVEQLVQGVLEKSADPKQARTPTLLLKLVEAQAGEAVFHLLEEEQAASNRSRLLSLARRFGRGSLRAALRRLNDERWYVVRNACYILGALGGADLGRQLTPALRHSDARVQEAAVTALIKSGAPNRGEFLAESLPHLQPHLQEMVLSDAILLKDPAAVAPLGRFLSSDATTKAGIQEKALQALAVVPTEAAVEAIGRILMGGSHPLNLRRAAFLALKFSLHPAARQQLAQFSLQSPGDPLARS